MPDTRAVGRPIRCPAPSAIAWATLIVTLFLIPEPARAAFPGGNGRIAFAATRDFLNINVEVYAMNPDGTAQVNLTNNAASDGDPAWSPDGTKIAFTSERDGNHNHEVYVMNADGTAQTNLTKNLGFDFQPAWSPDGTKIAFTSQRASTGGRFDVFLMNADGTLQANVTNNAASDSDPAWSPDGTKIAFTSGRDGNSEVYVMNADGTLQANLTSSAEDDVEPAWSPDGTKIAFTTNPFGNSDVVVMNADGTAPTNLTKNCLCKDYHPAWSPDGTKIAFVTTRTGNHGDVFVMNADGTAPTNLTKNAGFDGTPDWQPILNDAPVAFDDAYSTGEDATLSVPAPGVLGNDSDADTDALTAVLVSGPSSAASFTLNADGSFDYTPAVDFNGTDSFTYKANDGSLDSNVATVTITVKSVNDAPVAFDDAYSTGEDATLSVPAPGVLGNDSDADTDALTAVLVSGPSSAASFTLNADGSFDYTPAVDFNGTDSFTYKANDGSLDSNVATVTITVNSVRLRERFFVVPQEVS